ncbi:tail fiber assembly protein [Providencia stuartii]|uniref:tail fiber assembly protein n=1 Tax=Providencia stuartii TaxID=588 RepID=UPI0027DA7510|nr:tail fiber assembly protein [Providencia stuartii]
MNYYKDKGTGVVCAYDNEQLEQVIRLTELDQLIQQKEPAFTHASNTLQQAALEFSEAKELFELESMKSSPNDDELNELKLIVDEKSVVYEEALSIFNQIEPEYQPIKDEYDAILPVFFDIRESLKSFKKMTPKEVDAHLNPPISKEQLIAEAEQQKQSLLAEANNAIAPLQDAVDLDIATDEEEVQLTAWRKYRVLLNRVDTSTAPEIDWPEKP